MNNPRYNRTGLLLVPVLLALCFLTTGAGAVSVHAQQSDAQKTYDDAVKRLYKRDYSKALEGAEAALKVDPGFAPALLLKSQALVGVFKKKYGAEDKLTSLVEPFRLLKEAADSLDGYLKATPNAADAQALNEQLETLRAYGQLSDRANPSRSLFSPKEVTTKARIIRRDPRMSPPIEHGTVTVMAVLAADGRVKHIMLLDPVEETKAMREFLQEIGTIEFTPAVKDGRMVSETLLIIFHVDT